MRGQKDFGAFLQKIMARARYLTPGRQLYHIVAILLCSPIFKIGWAGSHCSRTAVRPQKTSPRFRAKICF